MDFGEAIHLFHIPFEQVPDQALFWSAAHFIKSSESYRQLTDKEGYNLALAALELYDTGINAEHYFPHLILTNLANVVSGSLSGLYQSFLQRDLYWPEGAMFREADAETRDHLITVLESGEKDNTLHEVYRPDRLVCMISWIGDEIVQDTFMKWRKTPPLEPSSPEYYLHEAGWELTQSGQRHNLYYQENYDLISIKEASAVVPGPITVISPHEGQCGWCLGQLITLFDIDLQDSRMSFLGIQGKRLRIAMCLNCTLQNQPVFTEVDGQGASSWSPLNGDRPGWLEIFQKDTFHLSPSQYILGQARKTVYESRGSHLGGCPDWVQSAHYPRCPLCQQTMTFVGQHEPKVGYIEGIIYAFLCASCGIAATGYQQT